MTRRRGRHEIARAATAPRFRLGPMRFGVPETLAVLSVVVLGVLLASGVFAPLLATVGP